MPLDTRIALGVQPLQLADPLAREGQVQNILASQAQQRAAGMQQQSAQMQMDQTQRQLRQDEDYVSQMADAIGKNGGPPNMEQAARLMATNRNPDVSRQGVTMLQSLQRLDAAKKAGIYGAPAPVIPNVGPTPGAMGSGTFGMDQNVPMFNQRNVPPLNLTTPAVNQLTPPPAAPVNQLAAAPQADVAKTLQAEFTRLSQFTDLPGVTDRMNLIKEQLKELSTPRVVGRNLVTGGGKVIFTAPQDVTLSDTARLIKERDALPLNDPNRALYDQQIKDLGATAQNARDRLAFDQEKLAYERANPGKTIKEITQADGSTQVVAIDNRTGMATQVMMAGAPGAAPAGAGRGAEGVTGDRVGPATPLVGAAKAGALTEAQGNAALFGSAMAQAQGVLAEVEKRGTRTGSVTTSLAQGIVKYVPLGVGDKLVGDVYALAMQDPTKLFGPDVDQQKLGQAQLAFSIAYLRKTSGAAFGPSELANTVNEFFPQIGEDASVTKQKSEARKRAIKGMKISAGKEGSKFIEEYEAPGAAGGGTPSANDPLGIRGK